MTQEETKRKKSKKEKTKDINIIKLRKGETVNITKALGSSKRLAILRLLSEKELNLSEIAEALNSTPQAIYHHLQILEKSRFVYVVREESIKNMAKTIKYYRANYYPDAINILLWAPLEEMEPAQLECRVPIPTTPVQRIVKKMAPKLFKDLTDYKVEVLTNVVKDMVDLMHESMNTLRKEYELELDERIWNLVLLFAELSTMNIVKKIVEEEKYRKHLDTLASLLFEEFIEEEQFNEN
ncbi:MAG: ArsR/SmtB family transcription factor [Candidatus Heimdallarchaeaceae archaeon]